MKKYQAGKSGEIRQKAENLVKCRDLNLEGLPLSDSIKIIHELQVHQIELELQNEELRRAAEALAESEARYFDLHENSPVSYITIDRESNIHEFNSTFATLVGTTKKSLPSKKMTDYIHPAWLDSFRQLKNDALNKLEKVSCELRIINKVNKDCYVNCNAILVNAPKTKDCNKPLSRQIRIALLDITIIKHSERILQQSQKMEALGVIAGGIAHDFNNVLANIVGFTDLLQLKQPETLATLEYLPRIKAVCDHGKKLVEQILTFSNMQIEPKCVVDIYPCLQTAAKLLVASLPKNIEFKFNTSEHLPLVFADTNQIQQIFFNMCNNALYAMQTLGGSLTVTLNEITHTDQSGYLEVAISDTGCGIPKDKLNRIFDPFYTSKPQGEGTGIGLAVVNRIVATHKGLIFVDSSVGVGTIFRVLLPVIRRNSILNKSGRTEKNDALPSLKKNIQNIILVDDNRELAETYKQMIETEGHIVEVFNNAHDALSYLAFDEYSVDLVITDLSMPNLSGRDLCGTILKSKPDMSIIIITGYSNSFAKSEALKLGIKAYLKKPVTMKELMKAIDDAATVKQFFNHNTPC